MDVSTSISSTSKTYTQVTGSIQETPSSTVSSIAFERRSINEGSTVHFDYIICAGVVHHNADSLESLCSLREALTEEGILELMVYNRFHRIQTTASRKRYAFSLDRGMPMTTVSNSP